MGEVYRARDTRLGRDVALKVLPADFAHDDERRRRFEREARLLASLNHPAIAVLHGLEKTDGVLCLVMELVEGATLLSFRQEPYRVPEALALARQIAEGLEAAHERGVLHRDLKPSNIMVTPEGRVKLLDFGLAKAMNPTAMSEAQRERATSTVDTIGLGVALGTAPYMSPEQARGEALDRRTDVWAFGCVLYQMLTGHRAFPGPTHAETIAAVLEREPNWETLPEATPPSIRRLLQRCLQKDKARRIHDIADARLEIEEATLEFRSSSHAAAAARSSKRGRWTWFRTAGVLTMLPAAFWARYHWLQMETSGPRSVAPPVTRSVIELPAGAPLGMDSAATGFDNRLLALSPDGRWLVYVSRSDGDSLLYRRALDRFDEPEPMAGTEGAIHAFFSPDSRSIGFLTDDRVKRISVDGYDLRTLCAAEAPAGGSWTRDDVIFYADNEGGELRRVAASGGGAATLEFPELLDRRIRFNQALPNGEAVLLTEKVNGISGDDAVIKLLDIRTRHSKTLVEAGYDPQYVAPDHLVFARGGNLMAVAFDSVRGQVTGEPVVVLRGVAMNSALSGRAQAAFSTADLLAYVPGSDQAIGRLTRLDRHGHVATLSAPPERYGQLSLSPDGTRLAVHVADVVDYIWVWDLGRNEGRRITGESHAGWPVWSPSVDVVAFASWQPGSPPTWSIQAQDVRGGEQPRTLRTASVPTRVYSWAGTKISILESIYAGGRCGLLSTDGSGSVEWDANRCRQGALSRDGHWMACVRNGQVCIRSIADPALQRQVSTDGGSEPRWCAARNLLFFRRADRWLATSVTFEPELHWEPPKVAFETDFLETSGVSYDVSPDGQYLYVVKSAAPNERRKVHLVTGWLEQLRRLVPAGP